MDKYKLLYNWESGKYWGFAYLINKKYYIFDAESNNKGWIDKNNRVFNMDGDYLGDLIDNNYILKKNILIEPISMVGRIPRNKPAQPQQRNPKKPRERLVGYYDVLTKL